MGASYTCASGKPLPNLGEKKCHAYFGDSGTARGMRMQVADVSRPLMSVSRAVDSGCRVVFDKNWSYIECRAEGPGTALAPLALGSMKSDGIVDAAIVIIKYP